MVLESLCPLRMAELRWQHASGGYRASVVCKATFQLETEVSPLYDEQEEVRDADLFRDPAATGGSSFLPRELVPVRARPEIVVVGSAFAPAGRPVERLVARLAMAGVDKALEICAPRHWTRDGRLVTPAPAARLPLGWERASTGPTRANPAGIPCGAALAALRQLGVSYPGLPPGAAPAPSQVPVGFALASPATEVPAVGFGPIAPDAPPRRARLGDAAPPPLEGPYPPDFDAAYFNCAPDDQGCEVLRGDERLLLEHLHPRHARFETRLGHVEPRLLCQRHGGVSEVPLFAELLWIDTERALATLTWRAGVALGSRDEELVLTLTLESGRRRSAARTADLHPVFDADAARELGHDPVTSVSSPRPMPGVADVTAALDALGPDAAPSRGAQRAPEARAALESVREDTYPGMPDEPDSFMGPVLPFQRPSLGSLSSLHALPTPSEVGSRPSEAAPPAPPPPAPPPMPPMPPRSWVAPHAPVPVPPPPPPILPPETWGGGRRPPSDPPPSSMGWYNAPKPPPPPLSSPWAGRIAAREGGGIAPEVTSGVAGVPLRAPGVLEASNAAQGPAPEPKAEPTARSNGEARPRPPSVPEPGPPPRPALKLLWFHADLPARLQADPRYLELVAETELRALEAGETPGDAASPARARREALELLALARPVAPDALGAAASAAVDDLGGYTPPVLCLEGELALPFDELETLRAAWLAVLPFGPADRKLKDALEAAAALLEASKPGAGGSVAPALVRNLQEAFAQAKTKLPPDYLDEQAARILLEGRHYKRRSVFGATWVRAVLLPHGVPIYLPDALAPELPLFKSFQARLFGELHPREDQYETSAACVVALGIGRILPRS
ncbi:MAG: DUF2169 domain-containing protein [Polyangiaceae bacterium]|nr:DUF2169 domain-containing protein [Polyangiaceae bacterium]